MMTRPPSTARIWGLRELLCSQFMLHETVHQFPDGHAGSAESLAVPLAHTPADIYKLLHQGEFGVGHSIGDVEQFGRNLARDLMQASADVLDPLLERVSLDGSVFRVNLGPYRRFFRGDETNACVRLFQVCLASARTPRGNEVNFLAMLSSFQDLNDKHALTVGDQVFAFPPEMVDGFLHEVSAFVQRFRTVPVLSHSPLYKRFNAPSYRVVDVESMANSDLSALLKEEYQW